MMRRRSGIVVAMAAVAIGAALLFAQRAPIPAAAPRAAPADGAATLPAASPPSPPQPAQPFVPPPPRPSLADALDRAQTGDVVAMRELGQRLMRCNPVNLKAYRQALAQEPRQAARASTQSEQQRALWQRYIDDTRTTLADCERLPPGEHEQWFRWLEAAALAATALRACRTCIPRRCRIRRSRR